MLGAHTFSFAHFRSLVLAVLRGDGLSRLVLFRLILCILSSLAFCGGRCRILALSLGVAGMVWILVVGFVLKALVLQESSMYNS